MKKLLQAIPLTLSGVLLGFAALGNLLQSYGEWLRTICGVVSFVLFVILVWKFLVLPASFQEDMKSPILAGVFGTFPMGMMLLSVYAKPILGAVAAWGWWIAIALHAALIVYFTITFVFKLQMQKVFTSYFIVYVGIVVGSVTAPAFSMQPFGLGLFYFGIACLIVLLGLIGYRYLRHKEIPEPARPLFCIFAAPASLCLTGYLNSAPEKSRALLLVLAVVAGVLYLAVLAALPRLLKLKFYPSYSAFTFPFVISATACKQLVGFYNKAGTPIPALSIVATVLTVIAAALVVYTLVRYVMAVSKAAKHQPALA